MTSQSRTSKRKGKSRASESNKAGPSTQYAIVTPAATQQSTLCFAQAPIDFTQQDDSQGSVPSSSTAIETDNIRENSSFRVPADRRALFPIIPQNLPGQWRLRKRSKRSTGSSQISWIFEYGMEIQKKVNDEWTKERYWLCKSCHERGLSRQVWRCESTNSVKHHLTSEHGFYSKNQAPALLQTDNKDNEAMDNWLQQPLKEERWRTDFINWIAHDNITFEQAASPWLRKVILGSGSFIEGLLPSSNTVRNWLLTTFIERKPDIRASLHTARSKIHLSCDASTTLAGKTLVAVVGHWLNEKLELKTALLGMKPLYAHTGSDIAAVMDTVIKDYDIGSKLGAFQMDNADSNDTCLDTLAELYPIDVNEQRLRCQGHIHNLVVKALLYGEGVSRFQKQLNEASDSKVKDLWRDKGAIGRLHNLIVYITRSPLRTAAFNVAQQAEADEILVVFLRLKKDTGVRWNSIYTMIERAIKLQRTIERYCLEWQRPKEKDAYDLSKDFLDSKDWEELRHYLELLKPFTLATKRTEGQAQSGSYGALWESLPAFDYLFLHLRKAADEISAHEELFTDHYRHCVNEGFLKLREYYTLGDRSRLYRAAVALHPCLRYDYFDEKWLPYTDGDKHVSNAKAAVQSLFDEYKQRLDVIPPSPPLFALQPTLLYNDDDDWNAFFRFGATSNVQQLRRRKRQKQNVELERFMEDELDTTFEEPELQPGGKRTMVVKSYIDSPLTWWKERGERLYPLLAQIAYDLFSIPAMSSECERIFSLTKKVATDERYQLKCDIIEADVCLKSWLQQRLVNSNAMWQKIQGNGDDESDTRAAYQVPVDNIYNID